MKIRLIACAVLLVALLVPAAPASATDQTLFDTWNTGYAAESKRAIKRFNRESRRFQRSDFRRWRGLYKASRAIYRIAGKLDRDIKADSASTPGGEEARTLALTSLKWSKRSTNQFSRGVRLGGRKRYRAAASAFKKSGRLGDRAVSYAKRTDRAFRALGLS